MKNQDTRASVDLKKYRKHIIITVFVFLLIFLVFAVYSFFDSYFYKKNSEAINDGGIVISSDNGGFPVTFTSDDIISADCIASKMFVVTKKMLSSISTSGKVNCLSNFTYAEPTMVTGEKYGIVYDRAGSRYMLFNKSGVINNFETDDKAQIIAAAINDKGRYVLVTKSKNSACDVKVFDKNSKAVYIWKCSDEYVVSVDISDDGEDIFCSAIGASDGVIYTKIYHLNIYEKKHVNEYIAEGSAVVDTKINSKHNVIVTCDKSRLLIDPSADKKESLNEIRYGADALACDSSDTGYSAVVSHKLGSFDKNELTLYDKKNRIVYKCDIDSRVSDIICKGRTVYLLTENSIIVVSNGRITQTVTTDVIGTGMVVCENKLYYYSSGTLRTGK